MRIIIDPRSRFNYASWFLLGLIRLFGKKSISFDIKPFCSFEYKNIHELNVGFAFILHAENKIKKYYINFDDVPEVLEAQYNWCDAYGMVNPTNELLEKNDKAIALGPEFGVSLDNVLCTSLLCLKNYFKSRPYSSIPLKYYLRDYLYTNIRRRYIGEYTKNVSVKENYIFHSSTLWYNHFAKTDTNYWRGEFLKACKKAGIDVEGGLFYIGNSKDILSEMPDYPHYKDEYKEFVYTKRISMDKYIRNTKRSVMVFNTPSVCGCHGWKLAEYLCMGKAIISTPLSRVMPYPMEHGRNIYFINTVDELYDAVVRINKDSSYRHKLEMGARQYYEKWIAPEQQIKRLMEKSDF